MQYRTLGRTGLQVSAVSMGTWKSFDVRSRKDLDHIYQLVTEALRCGVNLFDTAPMYGEAERVLGYALRGRREGVIVATKRSEERRVGKECRSRSSAHHSTEKVSHHTCDELNRK